MLSHYVKNEKNWDEYLDFVVFGYNTSPHESSKYSPFYLNFGRDPIYPIDTIFIPNYDVNKLNIEDWRLKLLNGLEIARKNAEKNMEKAKFNQKFYYDQKVRKVNFKVGDLVWLYWPPGKNNKLGKPWIGPCEIEEVMDVNVKLIKIPRKKLKSEIVHVNRIYKYIDRDDYPEISPFLGEEELEKLKKEEIEENQKQETDQVAEIIQPSPIKELSEKKENLSPSKEKQLSPEKKNLSPIKDPVFSPEKKDLSPIKDPSPIPNKEKKTLKISPVINKEKKNSQLSPKEKQSTPKQVQSSKTGNKEKEKPKIKKPPLPKFQGLSPNISPEKKRETRSSTNSNSDVRMEKEIVEEILNKDIKTKSFFVKLKSQKYPIWIKEEKLKIEDIEKFWKRKRK
jgi:hypothetical protein